MSERKHRIEPFRGLFFNRRAGDLASIVAPPYDLIDQQRQQQLYERSPYNVVRLELGREPDRYKAAAATLDRWIQDGIVVRAATPAIHHYTQKFKFEGRDYQRDGLIVTLRLEEFAPDKILPHERTFAAPKQDRLQLIGATQTNLSSIFGLYPGNHGALEQLKQRVTQRDADYAVRDDLGIDNELRAISGAEEIATIQVELAGVRMLIADGHHRYETALNYRNQRREEHNPPGLSAYDYVMITLTSCEDPGLLILPTHRVVHHIDPEAIQKFGRRARELFAIEEFDDPDSFRDRLKHRGSGVLGIALADSKLRILELKDAGAMAAAAPQLPPQVRGLDVSVLHVLVFARLLGIDEATVKSGSQIEYTTDARAALAAVREGKAAGAFLMNPPSIAEVERVSDAGATMPEKSTYFHPKLLTGMVMNPLYD